MSYDDTLKWIDELRTFVLTEWDEFNNLDWEDIFKIMRKPAWVFDTRVFLDKKYLKNIGFKVWSLGT